MAGWTVGLLVAIPQAAFLCVSACAQIAVPPAPASSPAQTECRDCLHIYAETTEKSDKPVGGLQAADFTLLDNNQPVRMAGFKAIDAAHPPADPVQVLIILDAINSDYLVVARERDEVGAFLKQNGGKLAYPTSIAVLTENGLKMSEGPSQDGEALLEALNATRTELRKIRTAGGAYADGERMQICYDQFSHLADIEKVQPGRKIVLFVSPGWPLLAYAARDIDMDHRQSNFDIIVRLSNGLREAGVTLYVLDPSNGGNQNTYEYQGFLNGVTKPIQAQYANLAAQVLAEHSGGRVIVNGNDIKGEINNALRDLTAYYELAFEPASPGESTEYHALTLKVDKPRVKVRTTAGYYTAHP